MSVPVPYPADTRAKGWRFEVDMEAVKASDTWLLAKTGAIRGALLLLWSEAWQQTPCGTLPNDDELIALLIDMPTATFAKNRKVLMRGWVEASDGRLYHETITKRVLSMLAKRANDAERSATRRARAAEKQKTPPELTRESRVTPPEPTREFDTKHQAPEPVNSVPVGTDAADAASPPSDRTMTDIERRKSEAWKGAKSLLNAHGMPKAQTGAFVGKLVTDYGAETVIDVLESAVRQRPAEPDAWIVAACKRNAGERKHPNKQEALEQRNRAVAAEWVAEMQAKGSANATV